MADLQCTISIQWRGRDEQGPLWAYMCIKPSMAKAFKDAQAFENFNLHDYGTVLEQGEGEDVPEEIKEKMERHYGVNHHYEDQLLRAIEQLAAQGAL